MKQEMQHASLQPRWSAADVCAATGGQLGAPNNANKAVSWVAGSVAIDSRNVPVGALFVAIKGERFDGHEFVQEALNKGAAAAVVSHIPAGLEGDARLVLVQDTMAALGALGQFARKRTRAKIVGITGSVGKTGTKEMLRTALAATGSTYATAGNYNNHIGVPLSLANLPEQCDYAVFELGMNHAGEIATLTAQVQPHAAIITTVEAVHLEFFDSEEGIADAKAEIFQGLDAARGVAIINRDNRHFARLQATASALGIARVSTFGVHEASESRLISAETNESGTAVTAMIGGTPIQYQLGTIGKHWALGSLAVLATVDAIGADLPKAAAALAHFHEPKGRGQLRLVTIDGNEVTLVDDSYNASPVSMEGAFAKVSEIRAASQATSGVRRRVLAVLGDMLELGPTAKNLHVGLMPSLVNNHIDLVFAAGAFMKHLYDALPQPMQGAYAETAEALAPKVMHALKHRDIVLVKGSHGSHMHRLVSALEDASTQS